ncbi:unnamed protein product [Ambrosiozyma monospora]|uniref:Unnamed protein product n=1 Tax=Ambrosiozyma monospora TaxID=43982 RepID=A0ACB5SS42_AMBMO|nr:unnamed protein product [Ambrosiozyma monospora]
MRLGHNKKPQLGTFWDYNNLHLHLQSPGQYHNHKHSPTPLKHTNTMLRREPTTIKLVPEDIKEFNREQAYNIISGTSTAGYNQNEAEDSGFGLQQQTGASVKERVLGATGSVSGDGSSFHHHHHHHHHHHSNSTTR